MREPADRASKMSAVDGEDLEVVSRFPANPARNVSRLSIPGRGCGIAEVDQARLAFGKIGDRSKIDPCFFAGALLQCRPQKVPDNRYRKDRAHRSIQQQRQFEEKDTPGVPGDLGMRRRVG